MELRQLLIFFNVIVLFHISFTLVLLPFKSVLHLGFKHQYAIIENPHTSRYTDVMLIISLMTCYSRLPYQFKQIKKKYNAASKPRGVYS